MLRVYDFFLVVQTIRRVVNAFILVTLILLFPSFSSECTVRTQKSILTDFIAIVVTLLLNFVGVLKSRLCETFLDAFKWIVLRPDPSICRVRYFHSDFHSIRTGGLLDERA